MMTKELKVIETDFGNVVLSKKTLNWLNITFPNWENVINNNRKTSKKSLYIKSKYNQLIISVNLASHIAWANGEEIGEY